MVDFPTLPFFRLFFLLSRVIIFLLLYLLIYWLSELPELKNLKHLELVACDNDITLSGCAMLLKVSPSHYRGSHSRWICILAYVFLLAIFWQHYAIPRMSWLLWQCIALSLWTCGLHRPNNSSTSSRLQKDYYDVSESLIHCCITDMH